MKTIILEGHGTWQQEDGRFVIPRKITIGFFCNHGESVPGNLSLYEQPSNIHTYPSECQNYRLWPLYGGMTLSSSKAVTVRFGIDNYKEGNFSLINAIHGTGIELLYLIQSLIRRFPEDEITIKWMACREVVIQGSSFFVDRTVANTAGISVNLFNDVFHHEESWPAHAYSPVEMYKPGKKLDVLVPYYEWTANRQAHGVLL